MFVLDNLRELLDGHGGFLHGITFKQRADTVRDLLVAGGDGSSCHEKRYVFQKREDVGEKKSKKKKRCFLKTQGFGWLVSSSPPLPPFSTKSGLWEASENLF